jgi:uncharacterized DUF497 family protein
MALEVQKRWIHPDHSFDEHRYLIIGEAQQERLLIVSYTEQDDKIWDYQRVGGNARGAERL